MGQVVKPPRDPKAWRVADWRDLWETLQALRRRILKRHAKGTNGHNPR